MSSQNKHFNLLIFWSTEYFSSLCVNLKHKLSLSVLVQPILFLHDCDCHSLPGIVSVIRCASNCVNPLKEVFLILKWMGEKFASFFNCIFFFFCKLWCVSVCFYYLNHVIERFSIKWGKITLRDLGKQSQQICSCACNWYSSFSKRNDSKKA